MIEPLALPEIAEDPPTGPTLEGTPDFQELEQISKVKTGSQFADAEPPDWREVARLATDLLSRSRDLRFLVKLAVARLNMDDLPAFASVLLAIRQAIESEWADLHPRPDPEEPDDFTVRSTALIDLSNLRVIQALRNATLAAPPREAKVTWHDVEVSIGAVEPEEGHSRRSEAEILGAFQKTDRERLVLLREVSQAIVAALAAIPKAFDAQAGGNDGPDFKDLPKVAHGIMTELVRREAMTAQPAAAEEDAASETGGEAPSAQAAAQPAGRSFTSIRSIATLGSREDALHALTLAADYFRTNEPSSPLPLLIDRAARLAPLPFMDILRDLAPDGLMQAQIVVGTPDAG